MKILANDGISASGVNALETAGFEVILDKDAKTITIILQKEDS